MKENKVAGKEMWRWMKRADIKRKVEEKQIEEGEDERKVCLFSVQHASSPTR